MAHTTTTRFSNSLSTARSGGMALPTALLVLVTLTLLGTAAVFTSATELDIAGNGRQELQALSVAEAGVHEALARLNMRIPSAPTDYRIVPDVDAVTKAPIAGWSRTIVNKGTLGAIEVQTLTGAFGSAAVLPVSTTIQYKREAAEQPISHCAGGCSTPAEVVRFNTAFGYAGTGVPSGIPPTGSPTFGPPVLQILSTYTDGASGATKTLVVEATRTVSSVNITAAVRACDTVHIGAGGSGTTTIDAMNMPGQVPIIGKAPSASIDPGTTVTPSANVQLNTPCPSNLFEQTFGMTPTDMKAIADTVTSTQTMPPSGTTGKIIYVTGAGNWQGTGTIGSAEEPVIAIFEGSFQLQTATCYCIIFATGQVELNNNAKVFGAVIGVGTGAFGFPAGTGDTHIHGGSEVIYDPAVIDKLAQRSPFAVILWSAR